MRTLMLVLTAVLVVVFAHTPAHANNYAWDKTTWGMFKEEIEKVYGFSLEERKSPSEDKKIYAKANHKIGNHAYRVTFLFTKNRLSEVVLYCEEETQEEAVSAFDEAKVALNERFGLYAGTSEGSRIDGIPAQNFYWESKNTFVSLMVGKTQKDLNVVIVRYRATSMPGVKGF